MKDLIKPLNDHKFLSLPFADWWRSWQTALKMLTLGQWRQAIILFNQKTAMKYIDFTKTSLAELGLTADCANAHEASRGELDEVLKRIHITDTDAIIDIGCGKGAAMVTMANYPFHKIAGLDLSPKMIDVAERNLSRLLLRKRTRLFCCDATLFSEWDEYTHIYFFNPFPCQIMSAVMENVKASLVRRPRHLTIIYNTPNCYQEILIGGEFIKQAEHEFHNKAPIVVYVHR